MYSKFIIFVYYKILALFFFRKKFKVGVYDITYRVGSGISDAFVFCNDIEVKAHKALFGKSEIYAVDYPTKGNCSCGNNSIKQNSVLFPVSYNNDSDRVSKNEFDLYLRDIQLILNEIGKDVCIHLRKHPLRYEGNWIYNFRDLLNKNGINSIVIEDYKPIREVMCNYLGMIGFASAAMVDASNSCNNCFVIAFEAISKLRYSEPKFVYGENQNINWIDEDGSYDKKIFKKKNKILTKTKTIVELIKELSEK